MPASYLRGLSGHTRTPRADRHLAHYLTLVAGAVNAGGFLIVGRYTSHMSGIVSAMANRSALRDWSAVLSGAIAVGTFTAGAAATAWLVNWGRRRRQHGVYALPLFVEALLLVALGAVSPQLMHVGLTIPAVVAVLCFMMGMQNALVTKVSRAEIRTTHVTGMITDLGIELGKLAYWNRGARLNAVSVVRADRAKIRVLSSLTATFLVGGVIGAILFARIGSRAALPLALIPLTLSLVPLADDLRAGNGGQFAAEDR